MKKSLEEIKKEAEEMEKAEKLEYEKERSNRRSLNKQTNHDGTLAGIQKAKELFPRKPFPWHVLPTELSDSFSQMADALGILPDPIPGIAMAVFASTIGRKIMVQGKSDHSTPMIIWSLDIRDMGGGKSPTLENLMFPIKELQTKDAERYFSALSNWNHLSKQEKKDTPRPQQARGYWSSSYTMEGLRNELTYHPTGGYILSLDEASKVITSQNAYRNGKGSDREDLCSLWNGNADRVIRTNETYSIPKCALNITGGIQKDTLIRTMGSENGLYIYDGTLTRFLLSYSPSVHIDISYKTIWNDQNREAWKNMILWMLHCAEGLSETVNLKMTDDAASFYYDIWRNKMSRLSKNEIKVPLIDGFITKYTTYALRFSGLLSCIESASKESEIKPEITLEQTRKAIELAEYYLGQAIEIAELFIDPQSAQKHPKAVTVQTQRLASVLNDMRGDFLNGMLTIGSITDKYNQAYHEPDSHEKMTSKKMGNIIAMAGLKKTDTRKRLGNQNPAFCLIWDETTEEFIKRMCTTCTSAQIPEDLDDSDVYLSTESPEILSEGACSSAQEIEHAQAESPDSQGSVHKCTLCTSSRGEQLSLF